MGLLAVLMIGGMAYQFTPALSGGSNPFSLSQKQGTPALKVNGQTITVEDLEKMRQGNPMLATTTGLLGDDMKTFLVSQQVQQALYTQGAKDVQVSREDVAAEVKKIRDSQNLQDNKAWTDFLQQRGLSDSEARTLLRDQLAVQRKVEEIQKAVPAPTEAELQTFYSINKENYKTDPQIVGREIVVADEAKAKDLLTQIKAGANFSTLASENSLENKERGGALGPIENGSPRPVSGVVLPTEVATAAIALTGGGVTDIITSGGKYYIVQVEKIIAPTTKSFEQAKSAIQTAVEQQKKDAALEAWVDGLRKNAQIEVIDPAWKVEDPVVASVAGQNIPYSEVLGQVVNNQQVAAMLQQLPPEQMVSMINTSLKPSIVQQLLTGYAAPTIAKNLNLNLVGSRQEQAQQLAAYGAKDVLVSDADIQKAYQENIKAFQTPASATVDEAMFKDRNQAAAFRADWNGQGDFVSAASKAGGTVSERGTVTAGDGKLGIESAVFGGQLRPVGEGSLSAVVPSGERFAVAYVRDLKPAVTKPLTEVRSQIEQQLLGSKQGEASQAFLEKQLAALKPTNNLQKVLDAQAKRVAAATPATPAANGTGTPGAGSAGTGSSASSSTGANSTGTSSTGAAPETSTSSQSAPATSSTKSAAPDSNAAPANGEPATPASGTSAQ